MAKPETPINILPDAPQVRQRKGKIILDEQGLLDLPFLALTLILLLIGLIMMFSASYARAYETEGNSTYYFARQALFAVIGVGAMLLLSRVPYQWWRRVSVIVLAVSVGFLMLVPLIGSSAGGARRWIYLGFASFQPSELAKFSVILMFASMISVYKDKMLTLKYGVLRFIIILGVICGLLVLEPHLSAILIILAVGAVMMFMGGTRLRWFGIGIGVVAALVAVYLAVMPYAGDRWMAWRDPFTYADDEGFQIVQSLYAIGSGGLTGLGLGRSRQKYLYLPEEHNDYIFAIVCEELGFIGAMVILLLFAMLIVRGYWIALHAKDRFGALLAAGITTLFALQVILNVAVVTNLLPATGISLPFFSYGGTALLLQLGEMGIVLSVSRQCDNKLL